MLIGVQTHLLPALASLHPSFCKGLRPGSPDGRHTHLFEAVDHEEDVGVADLRLLPFAVHGVFTGGRKHLLRERRFTDAVSKPAPGGVRCLKHTSSNQPRAGGCSSRAELAAGRPEALGRWLTWDFFL